MTLSLGAIRMPLSALALSTLFLVPAKAQDLSTVAADSVSAAGAAVDQAADAAADGAAALEVPHVEKPLRRLYCVEYARLRSGLAIFGDAKLWWGRARNLYEEFAQPAVDAVMVFSGSKRIRKGHVAVVTRIVSPREVIVDHANWQNHGEIDHDTPVLDVSAGNDWSKVRVWDINSNHWGARVYQLSGFIAGHAPVLASAGS
jgi:CHAP domain-containing protein